MTRDNTSLAFFGKSQLSAEHLNHSSVLGELCSGTDQSGSGLTGLLYRHTQTLKVCVKQGGCRKYSHILV